MNNGPDDINENENELNRNHLPKIITNSEMNETQSNPSENSDKKLFSRRILKIRSYTNSLAKSNNNIPSKTFLRSSEKLPLLKSQQLSSNSYIRMKQYKVIVPKPKKLLKTETDEEEPKKNEDEMSNKLKNIFGENYINIINNEKTKENMEKEGGLKYSERDENIFIPKKINEKIDFDDYIKLMNKAEVKLKPRFGEKSNDLANYTRNVKYLRTLVLNDFLKEMKNTENRYNDENPKVDVNLRSKEKLLIDNRWKNSFSLDEYQKYFTKYLKGKISSLNYRQMLKKFRQISLMCFHEGNLNYGTIKKMNYIE